MEQPECSDTASGSENREDCFGKLAVFTKLNIGPSSDAAIPYLGVSSLETQVDLHQKHTQSVLRAMIATPHPTVVQWPQTEWISRVGRAYHGAPDSEEHEGPTALLSPEERLNRCHIQQRTSDARVCALCDSNYVKFKYGQSCSFQASLVVTLRYQ